MTRRSPAQYNFNKAEFDETFLTKHFTRRTSRSVRGVMRHHMTVIGRGNGSALDACYRIWQTRQASAHIGVDGRLVRRYVRDSDNAWHSGNAYANDHYIGLEHANETAAPSWRVAEETWDTGAHVTAGLHRKHRLGRPRSSTVHDHRDVRSTECPGPFMMAIEAKYLRRAQAYYDGRAGSTPTTPKDEGLFGMSDLKALHRRKATRVTERRNLPLAGTGSNATSALIPGKGDLDYIVVSSLTILGIPADKEVLVRWVQLDPKGKIVGSSGWSTISGTSRNEAYGQVTDTAKLKNRHRLQLQIEPRGLDVVVASIRTDARHGR